MRRLGLPQFSPVHSQVCNMPYPETTGFVGSSGHEAKPNKHTRTTRQLPAPRSLFAWDPPGGVPQPRYGSAPTGAKLGFAGGVHPERDYTWLPFFPVFGRPSLVFSSTSLRKSILYHANWGPQHMCHTKNQTLDFVQTC